MNLKVIDNHSFYIKINNLYKTIDINKTDEIIKKILILIRKRYAFNILGFYEVKIYNVKNMITILYFKCVKNDSFYSNIDLKIIKDINEIEIKIDDDMLLDDLEKINNKKRIYKICEHYYFDDSNLHC